MNIYGTMQVKILNLYIINTRIYIHDKKVRAYVPAGVLFSKYVALNVIVIRL